LDEDTAKQFTEDPVSPTASSMESIEFDTRRYDLIQLAIKAPGLTKQHFYSKTLVTQRELGYDALIAWQFTRLAPLPGPLDLP
jgi:hypothetical protein